MYCLTHRPIVADDVLRQVQSNAAGAVALFLGTVREFTVGRQTISLEYTAYEPMALAELAALEQSARERWPLTELCLVHRLGHLELGETSVALAVSSPHRAAALEALTYLIETLKQRVPIWKQERWADGATEWVHPGVTTAAAPMNTVASPAQTDTASTSSIGNLGVPCNSP
jgi:molybdopterin synthase catalytic subunit